MRKLKPADYLKQPYQRVLTPEDEGGFSAEIPEFPGCYAEGETTEEALKNLEEVALAWLEAELESGRDIPQPWKCQEFSGRFALRMPKFLHNELVRSAEREGTSLNQYMVTKLSARCKEDELIEQLYQRLHQPKRYIFMNVQGDLTVAWTNPQDTIVIPRQQGTGTIKIDVKSPDQVEVANG